MSKKERLAELIGEFRAFRFCGPSDDPDEQTAVTTGYRYLLIQLKRLAAPFLQEAEAGRLNSIEVDVNDIMTAYDAHAEIDALLPDIEAAFDNLDEDAVSIRATTARIIDPELIRELENTHSVGVLVGMCKEINSCFAHGNLVATVLLMRAVLNHVPPLFGREAFSQVVATSGRSLKESFDYLENGLRKIADFHTHRPHGSSPVLSIKRTGRAVQASIRIALAADSQSHSCWPPCLVCPIVNGSNTIEPLADLPS